MNLLKAWGLKWDNYGMPLMPAAVRLTQWWLGFSGVKDSRRATRQGDIHFYDGSGGGPLPPVVLLHGLSANAAAFGPLIKRLLDHHRRVVAPDHLGHGLSGPPKGPAAIETLYEGLRDFLDAEIKEPMILVGNSLGGGLALRYALDRPQQLKGLVLISPGGAKMTGEDLAHFKGTFPSRSADQALEFMRRLYHRIPWYTSFVADDIHKSFAGAFIQNVLDSLTAAHYIKEEELASLAMPVMLIWGRHDRVMPAAHLDYFKKYLGPKTKIVEPDHVGHCPHLEDAGGICRLITDFSRQL